MIKNVAKKRQEEGENLQGKDEKTTTKNALKPTKKRNKKKKSEKKIPKNRTV